METATEAATSVSGIASGWNWHPWLQVGSTVWRLYLCGATQIEGDWFLHVAAVGPSIRRMTLFVDSRRRLARLDLSHAIAERLGAGDDYDGFDIMSGIPGS